MKPVRFPTRSPLGALRAMADHPVHFLEAAEALGAPVVRTWLGPFPQWFVFDAELGRDVLQRLDDDFNRPPYLRHLIGAVTGTSLFSSTGEAWGQRRRMLQPEFHRSRVQQLTDAMHATIDDELSTWPTGTAFDVQTAVSTLALRIAGRTMFGVDLAHVERTELGESFAVMSEWLTNRFYDPRALPAPIPTRANRRFKSARDVLRGFVLTLISQRRARPSETYDVLQVLLDSRQPPNAAVDFCESRVGWLQKPLVFLASQPSARTGRDIGTDAWKPARRGRDVTHAPVPSAGSRPGRRCHRRCRSRRR